MSRQAAGTLRWALFPLLLYCLPLSLAAYSYVRIVRLSFVEGEVRVVRPNSASPARGLANLPLEHDAVVETSEGVAEIEFEEEAFARLAPHSRLRLAELALLSSGARVTKLLLEEGTASVEVNLSGEDTFAVLTPHFQVTVLRRAAFRVDLTPVGSRVRVFQGEVRVEAPPNTLQVSAGQMLEWRPASGEALLTRNLDADAWDEWNQERSQVARTLLHYQTSLPGAGVYSTPWYTPSYSSSFCSGWTYDPFAGRWTWGPGGFIDPFFGWGASSWSVAGYPGCTTPWWYWQYGWGVIPRSPVSPDPPAPPAAGPPPAPAPSEPSPTPPPAPGTAPPATDAGEPPRFDPDRDRPERGPRPRRPTREDLFELWQREPDRAWPARGGLPGAGPTPGESLPTAEGTPAGGSPAVSECPRSAPPPRQPQLDRPGAVRPLARPSTPSPASRVSSRPSRTPAARRPAARSQQVRSRPSRSTPRPSRPASRPRPPKP